jgi:hypothetical protein
MPLIIVVVWLLAAGGIVSVGACWDRLRDSPRLWFHASRVSLTTLGTLLGLWFVLREQGSMILKSVLLTASLVLVAVITGVAIRIGSD